MGHSDAPPATVPRTLAPPRTHAPPRTLMLGLSLVALLLMGACAPMLREPLPSGAWAEAAHGAHVRYLVPAGRVPIEAPDDAVARLEAFLADVGPDWRVPERIHYYAFRDRDTLRALTPWDSTGRALLRHDAVISIYAADAHEVAHVLTAPPERPLRLANFWLEGIAMYYTWAEVYFGEDELKERALPRRIGVWRGRSVHAWSQDALAGGDLPALSPLVHGNRAFDALDDGLTYPAAGSFTTFLLGPGHEDRERIAAFRAFLSDANVADSPAGVRAAFEDRLGVPLDDAEAAWHDFLRRWDEAALGAGS